MTEQETAVPADGVQVTTTHLRALGNHHARAADAIDAAAGLMADADRSITSSHGDIAASTVRVMEELLNARRRCSSAAAHAVRVVSEDLAAVAQRYEGTDESAGVDLDRQIGSP